MLNWRHLHRNLDNLLNYFLNDLRNLNNSFDNSWDNHYPLNNSLNLNTLRDFNYLFNDFLFGCGDLFDFLEVDLLWNDALLLNHNGDLFSHDKRNILDNLHWFFFSEYDVLDDLNRDVLLHLNGLDEWHLMNLSFNSGLWDYYWHFNIFLNLSNFNTCLIDYPWHLYLHNLYLFNDPQHLPYHFDLLRR